MRILAELKEIQFALDQVSSDDQKGIAVEFLNKAKNKLQNLVVQGESWEEAGLYRGEGYDAAHRDGNIT